MNLTAPCRYPLLSPEDALDAYERLAAPNTWLRPLGWEETRYRRSGFFWRYEFDPATLTFEAPGSAQSEAAAQKAVSEVRCRARPPGFAL